MNHITWQPYKPYSLAASAYNYFVYSIVIYFNSLYIIYGALFCTSYKYQDVYKP